MSVSRDVRAYLTGDGDLVTEVTGARTLWPYTQARWRLWRATDPALVDPVNGLVLRAEPADIVRDLTAGGWHRPSDGAVHRTWVDGRGRRMFDHAALGDRQERIHVRLFVFHGHTLFAAHHEVMDDRGRHVVVSWDAAREAVGETLERTGYAGLAPTTRVTAPDLRGVAGDGRVWRWVGGSAA